eukprot:2727716-Rhodomonas_salina.3
MDPDAARRRSQLPAPRIVRRFVNAHKARREHVEPVPAGVAVQDVVFEPLTYRMPSEHAARLVRARTARRSAGSLGGSLGLSGTLPPERAAAGDESRKHPLGLRWTCRCLSRLVLSP